MNYANYINHTLYKPPELWRNYTLDLEWCTGIAKRVFLAALPYIALYKPAGKVLSLVGNGSRLFSHLQKGIEEQSHWKRVAWECAEVALAAIALGTVFFSFAAGTFISTASDLGHGIYHLGMACYKGDFAEAREEALQALIAGSYLGFMALGSLELLVVFAMLQSMTALYQSAKEFFQGNYIEAAAKLGLSALKSHSAREYFNMMERRNAFLKMERTAALFAKIAKARAAGHLINHPLSSLEQRIEENDLVFRDSEGQEIHFGANFHGNGGSLVKGENIVLRSRMIDGKEVIELEFKVNHAYKGRLENSISQLQKVSQKETQEILQLTGSHATSIQVKKDFMLGDPISSWFSGGGKDAHRIVVGGMGEMLVGADKDLPNLYDKVIVRMDAKQSLYTLHEMLCLLDLENAICLSTKADIERLKMGQLFRTFFPREALSFERSEEFFTMKLEDLKAKMIQMSPGMRGMFDRYYDKMVPESILGGRIRYRICGLSQEIYAAGGRALTAAITGAYTDEELFQRVASMLRMGMIATEVRQSNDMNQNGLSSGIDYLTGGADSVYTQMITEGFCKKASLDNLVYDSDVRILISLDALELGSYQYHDDSFGNRFADPNAMPWFGWGWDSYWARENILEFTRNEQKNFSIFNEVMLKERVNPSFFTGIVVSDEQKKVDLVNYLKKYDLIQDGMILGHAMDQFIRVGMNLKNLG